MSRIFLAGAAGVIGRRLTPLLLSRGHSVWGATRSPDNSEFLCKLGARPVVVDVFDAEALATAVLEAKPACGRSFGLKRRRYDQNLATAG